MSDRSQHTERPDERLPDEEMEPAPQKSPSVPTPGSFPSEGDADEELPGVPDEDGE